MPATITLVPTATTESGSSAMACHSSPRARMRPGEWVPSISRVTRAVSPTIPCTPFSTLPLYSAADENGVSLLREGGQGLGGVLRFEVEGLAAGLVLQRLFHGTH